LHNKILTFNNKFLSLTLAMESRKAKLIAEMTEEF